MSYSLLSYPLENDIPAYGGRASLGIKPVKSIARGDSCNVFTLELQNHWGTHVDGPNHFFDNGKTVADYPADFWFFSNPQVIEVKLGAAEILKSGEWMDGIRQESDLILFLSGWSQKRETEEYGTQNPGIAPEVGLRLRKSFPNVRAVGMDWISVSSYQNRELGREAHRAFLDPEGENEPVLLIEDMNLTEASDDLKEVIVLPLLIQGVDSAPCSVVGRKS